MTVVVPVGNGSVSGLPSLRELVTVTLSPVVVGVPASTLAWQLLSALAVLLGGQLIVTLPLVASTTVTEKGQPPSPCSELKLTMVVPTGKNEPEAGVAVIAPHVPVPMASGKVTCAPRTPFSVVSALTSMGDGHVRSQAVALDPVEMLNEAVELLSLVSGSAVAEEALEEVL